MAAKRKASAMLHHHKDKISTPEPNEGNEEDQYQGLVKDADKLKLMLLAWNYHSQAQARAGVDGEAPVPPLANDDVAGLWASYHSALGLAKGRSPPREQSSPVLLPGETGSTHDETSSSGQKDDEEGSEDESDERMDTLAHDPERLKAFNMFVRLFVDENLDRMVPISKQPKEKIQAIIDSCTRQFPEFAERARKRIRTYLKSCRRNKKCRDGTGTWDSNQTRPTPAHLTSVQAEQILAQACENESHNAKRMRVGLEPVSQPMPATTSSTTETTIAPSLSHYPALKSEEMAATSLGVGFTTVTATPTASTTPKPVSMITDIKPVIGVSSSLLNGVSSIACTSTTPTSMYRPNFTQAFQRASTGLGGGAPGVGISTAGYTGTLFPAQTFNPALVGNGPTDLSMKSRPLLSHKLSGPEMGAVRQLITGYRESAAFLLRSADELETLLLQQQ